MLEVRTHSHIHHIVQTCNFTSTFQPDGYVVESRDTIIVVFEHPGSPDKCCLKCSRLLSKTIEKEAHMLIMCTIVGIVSMHKAHCCKMKIN